MLAVGDEISSPDGDPYEMFRILFDLTFFFFVIVILLAIIQGEPFSSFSRFSTSGFVGGFMGRSRGMAQRCLNLYEITCVFFRFPLTFCPHNKSKNCHHQFNPCPKITKKVFLAGAPLQTWLGKLMALPQTPSWIWGRFAL